MLAILTTETAMEKEMGDGPRHHQSVDLSKVPTCDLHFELIKRAGVDATFLGPDDKLTVEVQGVAWVIINRD